MSNINPNRFVPTPGKPTAAPARFPYDHRTMAGTKRAETFRHCWGCVARNVCPWPNDCPRCGEMAA